MFSTGLSGLGVAQAALLATAHNTANVHTAGYSRQAEQVATNGSVSSDEGFIGTGARVTTISRSYDRYLTAQLTAAQSSSAALGTYGSQINRIDTLLADRTAGLAPLMQGFFAGVQGVANAPADPAARQQLISSAQALASKFRSTDQYLTDLNSSVNDQIVGSVDQINTYATQIASLNQQISQLSAMAGGQPPNDLMDQRDQLVSELSKIIDVKVLAQDSGKFNVFVGTGQSLVVGDRAASVHTVNSAADPTRKAVALVGIAGNVSELGDNAITGGSLGGLMAFRAETLTPTQNAVGRLAMALSDTFNAQHKLGVDLNGVLGQNFFTSAAPGVFSNARNTGNLALTGSVSDPSQLTTSDYSVDVKAGTPKYVVTRLSDKQPIGSFNDADFPVSFDGVTVSIASGAAQPGDSFLIQPTRTGSRDMDVLVRDPAQVAAASPVITGNAPANKGSGALGAAIIDAGYLASPLTAPITLSYDATTKSLSGFPDMSVVPYTPGAKISFDGITVSLTGVPADGDTFSIGKNVSGVSDGSNALLLGGLQRQMTMAGGTTTFNGAYAQLVSTVGNRAMEVNVAETTQNSVTAQIKASQQSISGVNQDEETANLLMFQQMYQANAKVIQTASAMFDAILGINR